MLVLPMTASRRHEIPAIPLDQCNCLPDLHARRLRHLTYNAIRNNILNADPMRGASRGVLGVGSVRRLRAWFAATHSGGAGAPPGTTMSPREELADDPGWNTRTKARPGAGRRTPLMERRKATRSRKGRDIGTMAALLGAPSPSLKYEGRAKTRAHPRHEKFTHDIS
jgi:hypothetical protein